MVAEKSEEAVTPAQAGVQKGLDSRFRGNDRNNKKNFLVSNLLEEGM
jgi:hypothetical protein